MSLRPRPLAFAAALLLAFSAIAPSAFAADSPAETLARKAHERPDGRDLSTLGRMAITDKGKAPRIREIASYRVELPGGERRNLIRFLYPEDIAGTGFLGSDKADGSSDQWLYLPALDRVRRVSSDRKGGRFVGSDLYFEDLQERSPDSDSHRLLGSQTEGGVACDILESVPKDTKSSSYGKRVSWIDPATLLPMRVDYFRPGESQPFKRWSLLAKKKIQGYWTSTDSRMTDLETGSQTRMVVDEALYDRNLPESLFSSRMLSDEAAETEFRP